MPYRSHAGITAVSKGFITAAAASRMQARSRHAWPPRCCMCMCIRCTCTGHGLTCIEVVQLYARRILLVPTAVGTRRMCACVRWCMLHARWWPLTLLHAQRSRRRRGHAAAPGPHAHTAAPCAYLRSPLGPSPLSGWRPGPFASALKELLAVATTIHRRSLCLRQATSPVTGPRRSRSVYGDTTVPYVRPPS